VGWYFVPLANVVKPYQVMMELWRRSHAGWVARRSKLVVAWWGCWLLANALANVAARIFTQAQSDAQLANASAWLLVSYGLDVPMALLAMALVHRVTTLQRTELARAEGSFQNT
jgi:hypothetical protein